MARKTVYFTTGASCAITVEVPDDADDDLIIDLAWEELPGSLCASCSGYSQNFSVDLGDWEQDTYSPVVDA